MQRWEYKVVTLPGGRYTETLNDFGRDGWELVDVAPVVQSAPTRERGRSVPVPRAFGKLEEAAAAAWSKVEASSEPAGQEPGSTTTTLLWVLRRPLEDS
jgi:hypothetical protein